MRATWLSGVATALQLNFGLERKTPRGGPAHAARCPECQMAFSVARACVTSRAMRGSRGSVTGSRWLTPPLGPGKGNCVWLGSRSCLQSLGWDSLSPPHLISFANVCVARCAKQCSGETRTPKGSLSWERWRRNAALGDAKARAGKEGGGKKRKVVTSGWKVTTDWLVYSCFLAATPSPSFVFFFLLQVCFRFLICKVKSSFFLSKGE